MQRQRLAPITSFFSIITSTTVIILPLLLLCHSILSSCHTIILDNRRPEERSCSKVTCSKYLSPDYLHHHDHWPSFFKRRKDSEFGNSQGLDDVSTAAAFNAKDLQDIESLNSELETVEKQESDSNNSEYSKGNDVGIGRRKRRGISEYGTMAQLINEGPRRDVKSNLIYGKDASQLLWRSMEKDNRLKMSREKRSSDKGSKQRMKERMRKIRCCQRLKEKEGSGEGGSSGELKDSVGEGNVQQEFHHRFGSSLPVHHPNPHSLPVFPFHSPPPSLHSHPIFFPPFIPNMAPFDPFSNSLAHHQNSLHFSLLGPSPPVIGHEAHRFHNPLLGINQNANSEVFANRHPFSMTTIPPSEAKSDENKSEMQEESTDEKNERSEHHPVVDEEDDERRRIDHEMDRKRHFMLMSGEYQPYQPWIHGPILPLGTKFR